MQYRYDPVGEAPPFRPKWGVNMMLNRKAILAACALPLGLLFGTSAQAQNQDMYVSQLFLMSSTYCPIDSLEANGAVVQIRGNEALYSLVGTTFGGDGKTNFALPKVAAPLAGTRYCIVVNGTYPIRY